MLNAHPISIRDWLQKELIQRCQKNPKYSIRAFAKLLKVDSSSLSQILSGKRKVSKKLMAQFCARLGAPPELTRSLSEPHSHDTAQADYRQLTLDAFAVISDWYHYAILELTFVKGFKNDPAWIARKLGISVTEARSAVERLLRLELLELSQGRLIKTDAHLTNFEDEITAPALRQLQKQVLEKAALSLENTPVEERDMSSMTMAIDPEKLPEAKRKITQFRRSLCKFLEDGKQTQVYHLGIALYPVSEKGEEK